MKITREYKYEGDILYLRCTNCGEWLTIDGFSKDKDKKFGVRSDCKNCHKIKMKTYHEKWYEYNKENQKKAFQEYRKDNKDKILKRCKDKVKSNSELIGFNRETFHRKARLYVTKNRLKPNKCPICKKLETIEMHHPSYNSFDEWSKVVFCCKKCHSNIHHGYLECPKPINLLEM